MFITPLQEIGQGLADEIKGENRPRKKRDYVRHDLQEAHNRLFKDYFADDSTYSEDQFRRRFRMHQKVFMRIVNDLSSEYQHFSLRHDAAKSVGLSPIQKCTAGIRMFAYGMPGDACDEYVKISASTIIEFLKQFCKEVIHLYEGIYLRKPNAEDLERLLRVVEDHGFPGMISSIDCMHWEWRNYPVGWQGQFRGGHHGAATIILEAVASFDIWHAFFGLPSTLNDINVLDRSPVFDFRARWPTFIQSIRNPQGEMEKLFMERHETYRKHVERAFGVLQSRFQIIQESARLWDLDDLSTIMRTCIILHNMIVEDERATYGYNQGVVDYEQPKIDRSSSAFQYTTNVLPQIAAHVRTIAELHDKIEHL